MIPQSLFRLPNGSRLSLSPRECAGSGWFWILRDLEAGAAWPSVQAKVHYTYISFEERTNEDTKPEANSA